MLPHHADTSFYVKGSQVPGKCVQALVAFKLLSRNQFLPFFAGCLALSLMSPFVLLQIVFSSFKVGLQLFIESKLLRDGFLPTFPPSCLDTDSSLSEPQKKVARHLAGDTEVSPCGHKCHCP